MTDREVHRPTRVFVYWIALLSLFTVRTIAAQPAMPPDVQAIYEKMRAGKDLTETEEARLDEWGESMEKAVARSSGAPAKTEKPSETRGAAARPQSCPKAGGMPLPASAPGHDEYEQLLKAMVVRHSGGDRRAAIDGELGKAPAAGSEVGAFLHVAGDDDASIYALATVALRSSRDAVVANNLGVALTSAGEFVDAARVLSYADSLQPGAALVAINRGWVQFAAGQFPAAENEFRKALLRNPDLAGAEGGLGMVCACRGEMMAAKEHLEKSLKRRYSAVFAGAYRQAKEQLKPSELPPPQPGSDSDAKLLPQIPITESREKSLDGRAAVEKLSASNRQRIDDLSGKLERLLSLMKELDARNSADEGSAMVFRRTFERDWFEFSQVVELTLGQRLRPVFPAIEPATEVIGKAAGDAVQRQEPLISEAVSLQKESLRLLDALAACGDDDICKAPLEKRSAAVEARSLRIAYELCVENQQVTNVMYTQMYRVWKPWAAAVRTGADDLYVLTDPILSRVYAPALNEYLEAYRETVVRMAYQQVLDQAAVLYDNASQESECEPPPQSDNADIPEADLPKAGPGKCPLDKPVTFKLLALSFEIDCEKLTVEGGELLMGKVQYNYAKDETTIWVGAGVSGGGAFGHVAAGESDSGSDSNILPTQIAPSVSLEGKVGMSFSFRGGKLQDVGLTADASGSISAGGASVSGNLSSAIAVEGGLKFGGGAGYQLPRSGGSSIAIP